MTTAWPEVPLGEVLTAAARPERVDPLREYRLLGVRLDGEGPFLWETKAGSQMSATTLYKVEQGDFMYSRLFAWRGAFGLIPDDLDGCYVSGEFPTFRAVPNRLDLKFLRYWFRLRTTLDVILADCTGSTPLTRNRFKEEFFLRLEIPLPPLPEQRRIVARIEELAGKVAAARDVRANGALAMDAILLSRLNTIFGDFYAGERGELRSPTWAKLGEASDDIADGPHVTPTYVDDGIPFITVLNITTGRVRFDAHKYITPADHVLFQRRAKAEVGDVLISKDGTIGVPCIVDTSREFSFFVSVALVKPKRGVLDGEYLTWVIRAPYMQTRIQARSRGDMIRHLVLGEIRDLTVPLVPIATQRRIVAELDALQKKMDELKRLRAETQAELDALLPSILDRAFKGKL